MKRFLFFLVHPAKYHAFRETINALKRRGHIVDVVITSKDMLEELVQHEKWDYTNIFPQGRRIAGLQTYLSAAINTVRTITRLLRYTHRRPYDLYVTDDLLTVVGRLRGVPSIFFTDDDITAVPESALLAATATHIVSPSICNMGRFEWKQLGYLGYKALAHLHPNRFTPDRDRLIGALRDSPFFFLRLVSATSTHDVGKTGLTDVAARQIIEALKPHGHILINSQRELPADLRCYQWPINRADVAHYLAFAELFVSDSTTMCVEAAVLGTPTIEIDDWYQDFRQYHELHDAYGLIDGYAPSQLDAAIAGIQRILEMPDRRAMHQSRLARLLRDKIDVSSFLTWLFENYPASADEVRADPDRQRRFLHA